MLPQLKRDKRTINLRANHILYKVPESWKELPVEKEYAYNGTHWDICSDSFGCFDAISFSCSFFRYLCAVEVTIVAKNFRIMSQTTVFQMDVNERSHFFTWAEYRNKKRENKIRTQILQSKKEQGETISNFGWNYPRKWTKIWENQIRKGENLDVWGHRRCSCHIFSPHCMQFWDDGWQDGSKTRYKAEHSNQLIFDPVKKLIIADGYNEQRLHRSNQPNAESEVKLAINFMVLSSFIAS